MVEVLGVGAAPLRTVQFSTAELFDSPRFPDQEGGYYEVRPGLASGPVPPGVPIAELLAQAGVSAGNATYAYVVGSTSYRAPLTSATRDFDPSDSNEFVDGLQPVFYPIGGTSKDPDTVGYVRPLHKNDSKDTNNLDYMQVAHGGAFTVQVHLSGALLQPELKATSSTVRVGQSVSLSATAADPVTGEALDWTLNTPIDHEGPVTGAMPSFTTQPFTAPGTYYVQASVTGSNGSSGESNTVAITVKSRTKTPTPRTSGPGRGAGSSTNPIGGPVTGSRGRYNGRPDAAPTGNGNSPSPSASPRATSSVPMSVPSAAGSATSGASAPGSTPLVRPSGGQLVAGFALVDPAGASAARQSRDAAPAAAIAARAGGRRVRASLAWVGVACILALLLAGVGLERRRAFPGPLYGRKKWRHR